MGTLLSALRTLIRFTSKEKRWPLYKVWKIHFNKRCKIVQLLTVLLGELRLEMGGMFSLASAFY